MARNLTTNKLDKKKSEMKGRGAVTTRSMTIKRLKIHLKNKNVTMKRIKHSRRRKNRKTEREKIPKEETFIRVSLPQFSTRNSPQLGTDETRKKKKKEGKKKGKEEMNQN